MCSFKNTDRSVEIEGDGSPDPDHRWSDSREAQSVNHDTQTNMPGAIAQNDLAAGTGTLLDAESEVL
jgi:hypothetical protein